MSHRLWPPPAPRLYVRVIFPLCTVGAADLDRPADIEKPNRLRLLFEQCVGGLRVSFDPTVSAVAESHCESGFA